MKGKRNIGLVGALVAALCFGGCGPEFDWREEAMDSDKTKMFSDAAVPSGMPKKVALLSPTLIGIADAMGIDYGAYADSPGQDVPPSAEGKVYLGALYRLDTEILVSWHPDLAVGIESMHDRLRPLAEANHIPFLLVSLTDYERLSEGIFLLGKAVGKEKESRRLAERMEREVTDAAQSVTTENRTCVIIQGTGRGLSVETKETVAVDAANRLRLHNLFADSDSSARVKPFSMEDLIRGDPDIVFFTSIVRPEKQEEIIGGWLKDQPAWQSLRAVREGHVYFLPQSLFHSPGIRYSEAVRYMANILRKKET